MASLVELVLPPREKDLGGGFVVRRLLPSMKRRTVGPFIFFDHLGPVERKAGEGFDVRPHPHINLATVTYLFEGELLHRDSLGEKQLLTPGAINWMTAGKGIVHSERSPDTSKAMRLHALQLWVALPLTDEEIEPSFQHCAASDLPVLESEKVHLRVLAGNAYDHASPVRVLSPLFYVSATIKDSGELALPDDHDERAAYVVSGEIECEGERFREGTMIIFAKGVSGSIRSIGESKVMLLGGAPLEGKRYIWWNFVSSSEERIEQAKRDWKEKKFPLVPGDEEEFIPLPDTWSHPA